MRAKVIFIVLVIMVVMVLSAGSLNVLNTGLSESRKMLVMRNIGHELLTSSGDSTSRVMPVRKLDEQTFLLEFENDFSFFPDSLIEVVHRTLSKSDFPAQYAVHVMSCADRSIVYNYEMTAQEDLIPCRGREQPSGCYAVQITFSKPFLPYNQTFLGGIALAGLVLIGFVTFGVNRKSKKTIAPDTEEFLAIGSYKFYPKSGLLSHPKETLSLSRKETTLLTLFAHNPNELLLRDRLLKEVWEDEGVITGRSLDMFVSKLRKKLHHDSAVNLVNVHGKGYRLEV
jgi:hypothetical protein